MRPRTLLFFLLSIAISLGAAGYRWGDSSHAMGLINQRGGKTLHRFTLASGKQRYVLVATATVLPPFRGDIRVVLEGGPAMDYGVYDSLPLLALGPHHRPELHGDQLVGLKPGDRVTLWVVMRPRDPRGLNNQSANESPPAAETAQGPGASALHGGHQPLALKFYDTSSRRPVLTLPIVFDGKEVLHGN
jgi:hypothetical protein